MNWMGGSRRRSLLDMRRRDTLLKAGFERLRHQDRRGSASPDWCLEVSRPAELAELEMFRRKEPRQGSNGRKTDTTTKLAGRRHDDRLCSPKRRRDLPEQRPRVRNNPNRTSRDAFSEKNPTPSRSPGKAERRKRRKDEHKRRLASAPSSMLPAARRRRRRDEVDVYKARDDRNTAVGGARGEVPCRTPSPARNAWAALSRMFPPRNVVANATRDKIGALKPPSDNAVVLVPALCGSKLAQANTRLPSKTAAPESVRASVTMASGTRRKASALADDNQALCSVENEGDIEAGRPISERGKVRLFDPGRTWQSKSIGKLFPSEKAKIAIDDISIAVARSTLASEPGSAVGEKYQNPFRSADANDRSVGMYSSWKPKKQTDTKRQSFRELLCAQSRIAAVTVDRDDDIGCRPVDCPPCAAVTCRPTSRTYIASSIACSTTTLVAREPPRGESDGAPEASTISCGAETGDASGQRHDVVDGMRDQSVGNRTHTPMDRPVDGSRRRDNILRALASLCVDSAGSSGKDLCVTFEGNDVLERHADTICASSRMRVSEGYHTSTQSIASEDVYDVHDLTAGRSDGSKLAEVASCASEIIVDALSVDIRRDESSSLADPLPLSGKTRPPTHEALWRCIEKTKAGSKQTKDDSDIARNISDVSVGEVSARCEENDEKGKEPIVDSDAHSASGPIGGEGRDHDVPFDREDELVEGINETSRSVSRSCRGNENEIPTVDSDAHSASCPIGGEGRDRNVPFDREDELVEGINETSRSASRSCRDNENEIGTPARLTVGNLGLLTRPSATLSYRQRREACAAFLYS
eukprot:TRINITY_DN6526_c0_g1_i3.p1 TRINITY_DN6526_c0_g1~~TRINITY_DN6526_c0_g1_i3.p1  ORF type:complete len:813 (-),score=91.70 TRINITY_DN6526_c0_g1_i3:701-3139(-)